MALGTLTQVIEIIIKGRDESMAAFQQSAANAKLLKKGWTEQQIAVRNVSQGVLGFGKGIIKTYGNVRRFSEGIRQGIRNMFRFRMELLSVMFFGMGLSALFLGLLQPALQLSGIFEIWSTILQVLFLPVVLALLPILLDILDWVLAMPEETKKMIGMFVIIGAILGTVMMVVGMFGLGIFGLVTAFVNLTGAISNIAGPFAGILQALLLLGSAVIGVKVAFGVWELIKPIIDSFFEAFNMKDIVIDFLEKMGFSIDKNKNLWQNLKDIAVGAITSILEKIGISQNDIDKWTSFINRAIDFIDKHFTRFKNKTTEALDAFSISLGISSTDTGDFWDMLDKLFTKIEDLLPSLGSLAGKLVDLALKIDASGLIGLLGKIIDLFNGLVAAVNKLSDSKAGQAVLATLGGAALGFMAGGPPGAGIGAIAGTSIWAGMSGALPPAGLTSSGGVPTGGYGGLVGSSEQASDSLNNYRYNLEKANEETMSITFETSKFRSKVSDANDIISTLRLVTGDANTVIGESSNAFGEVNDSASYLKDTSALAGYNVGELGLASTSTGEVVGGLGGIIQGVIDFLLSAIGGVSSTLAKASGLMPGGPTSIDIPRPTNIPIGHASFNVKTGEWSEFAHGGLVTKPTLAMLGEAGPEMVTPLGQGAMTGIGSINPIYNISANVSSDVDISSLARKLNDALVSDYRRLSYR